MPSFDTLPRDGITVAKASEITGLDRRQILRLIERGDIAGSVKLDGATGAWLLPRAVVERIAKERVQ